MGYGAYMNVINDTSTPLLLFITDVNCMYDGGGSPSNLSLFNNAVVAAGAQLPGGDGQFIEAKGSGSCFMENSTFTLKATVDQGGALIGQVAFSDTSHDWNVYDNSNPSSLNVYVNNSGSTAVITITVASTSSTEDVAPTTESVST